MQFRKKKDLAAKVLKVGRDRVVFSENSLAEIKEAITRQDILDLHKTGAIKIREVRGRKKIVRRKHRRRTGKIKMPVKKKKQEYVIITRKLRIYLRHLLKTSKIDRGQYEDLRKRVRARKFKSKRHLKESI